MFRFSKKLSDIILIYCISSKKFRCLSCNCNYSVLYVYYTSNIFWTKVLWPHQVVAICLGPSWPWLHLVLVIHNNQYIYICDKKIGSNFSTLGHLLDSFYLIYQKMIHLFTVFWNRKFKQKVRYSMFFYKNLGLIMYDIFEKFQNAVHFTMYDESERNFDIFYISYVTKISIYQKPISSHNMSQQSSYKLLYIFERYRANCWTRHRKMVGRDIAV